MREIKFRVYDEGRIKYPEEYKENKFDNYFIDLNGKLRYYQNCYDGGFFDTENAKLMQFTGLYDKNEKEIYEGDIIHIPEDWEEYGWASGENYEIDFKDGRFRLKPKYKPNATGYDLEFTNELEVIGNIYENPELLKGADNIE